MPTEPAIPKTELREKALEAALEWAGRGTSHPRPLAAEVARAAKVFEEYLESGICPEAGTDS